MARPDTGGSRSSEGWAYQESVRDPSGDSAPVPMGSVPFTVAVGPLTELSVPGWMGLLAIRIADIVVDAELLRRQSASTANLRRPS